MFRCVSVCVSLLLCAQVARTCEVPECCGLTLGSTYQRSVFRPRDGDTKEMNFQLDGATCIGNEDTQNFGQATSDCCKRVNLTWSGTGNGPCKKTVFTEIVCCGGCKRYRQVATGLTPPYYDVQCWCQEDTPQRQYSCSNNNNGNLDNAYTITAAWVSNCYCGDRSEFSEPEAEAESESEP